MQFQLVPIQVSYSNLQKHIESFYERLDETIVKSNHDAIKSFEITEQGYDRHYMHIVNEGKIYGLACLNYDQNNLGGHRCYIRHFSMISLAHLKQGLEAVV